MNIKLIQVFLILFTYTSISSAFLGHRMGGGDGGFSKLPDNSLIALQSSLLGVNGQPANQHRSDFVLEFDVRETKDHQLIIYHDVGFVNGKKIYNMNLSEIKNYGYGGKCKKRKACKSFNSSDPLYAIPTLEDVLDYSVQWGLVKKMAVDIKHIYSDEAKSKLFELLSRYRQNYGSSLNLDYSVFFIANKDGFKSTFARNEAKVKSFKSQWSVRDWCLFVRDSGYPGVQNYGNAGGGNFCSKYY